jgi:hypothetical protein
MVNFSVFNELSLPLDVNTVKEKFGIFFKLLTQLKNQNLNTIRMSDDFKNYQILNNITFQKFLGQQEDIDFQRRLKGFINFSIIKINSPIIQENEKAQIETQQTNEYFYKDTTTDGGLACCDVWNTIAISFDSSSEWDKGNISIERNTLDENGNIVKTSVEIKHASKADHLKSHTDFFDELQHEIKQNITRENLWNKRDEFFPQVIVFCPKVERQIKTIDKTVFDCAISILRDIELKQKKITDFNWSPENQSVSQNPKLKQHRMFTIDGKQAFIENHIKSLPSGYRIYFLERGNKIHIGYIGKHLPLK